MRPDPEQPLLAVAPGLVVRTTSEAAALLSEPLLDAEGVATLFAVKPSWVYEAVRSRRLPHLKVGRHVRFVRADLEAWVDQQRQVARKR
jgi:excisionase family DNA binding protein